MSVSRRTFVHAVAAGAIGTLVRPRLGARGRIVDFHNHYFPPQYLDAVRSSSSLTITADADGNPVIHYPGNTTIIVRGHRDLDFRERVLDEYDIDTQVLTFPNPGTHVEPPVQSVPRARAINDAFGAIVAKRPRRFAALATLPLNDPDASARELERAVKTLGFRGTMMLSNVSGVSLSDQRFWPLYEQADALGAVLYVHPTYPAAAETMTDFRLTSLVGFPMDTTLAAARLVFSGVAARFPRITWVLANLGGTIPFLAERLDRGFHAFKELRTDIDRPPSDYLRRFYYDTVNFDPRALRLAIDFAGADHLLAGSDYPQQIGSLRSMLESIHALPISESEKDAILGGNASRLLRL